MNIHMIYPKYNTKKEFSHILKSHQARNILIPGNNGGSCPQLNNMIIFFFKSYPQQLLKHGCLWRDSQNYKYLIHVQGINIFWQFRLRRNPWNLDITAHGNLPHSCTKAPITEVNEKRSVTANTSTRYLFGVCDLPYQGQNRKTLR